MYEYKPGTEKWEYAVVRFFLLYVEKNGIIW